FLHRNLSSQRDRRGQGLVRQDARPTFEIVDTEYGQLIAARRDADEASYYWRISQFVLPWYTMFPPFIDECIGGHAWLPLDAEVCWKRCMNWRSEKIPRAWRPRAIACARRSCSCREVFRSMRAPARRS